MANVLEFILKTPVWHFDSWFHFNHKKCLKLVQNIAKYYSNAHWFSPSQQNTVESY